MTKEQLTAVEDLALAFANEPPIWFLEDSAVKVRCLNRRYWVLDEVDASRLDNLRQLIPVIIEERRKLSS